MYIPGSGGRIYAIGGSDMEGGVLRSVERFDPEQESWERVTGMPIALCDFAAVAGAPRARA